MMAPDSYSAYGDDTSFTGTGVDSVLSRDQPRSRRHLYETDRRKRRGNGNSNNIHRNSNRNSNSNRRFDPSPPRQISTQDDDSSKLLEEDALDSMFQTVEKGFGLNSNSASLLADTRRKASPRGSGFHYDDDDVFDDNEDDDYDEEKQHSQQNSSDMDGYYLATAASPEMQSVDDSFSKNSTNLTTNAPSNVLAYILGGFGLCPPDQAGMDADAQVSHFQTLGPNTNDGKTNNKSGGFGTFCMPDQKGLATDAQVSHFETAAKEENRNRFEGSTFEEKTDDAPHKLQETAAFPFNTRQFSTDRRRPDPQVEEEPLQRQQREQDEQDQQLDAVIDTGAQFCAPPDCLIGEKKDATVETPEMDEEVPPGMSPQTELPPPDLEDSMNVVRQNSLMDEDAVQETRLDEIRKKKRTIEQQVNDPSHSQSQLAQKYKTQTERRNTPVSLRNKVIVSLLVLVCTVAVGLVGVSFFWPDLMPKTV
jgi:hypothetical protein